jgi:ABC-type lipoprotein release transport system permease subunit
MIGRLSVRNLLRNRWRSALTAGGVAVAVAMLVWTVGLMDGMSALFIRSATAVEMGQVQVHRAEYIERSSIYHAFDADDALLEAIRAVPHVAGATGRVIGFGLVGHETRSQVARLVGVSPAGERATTLVAEGIREGRWLADAPAEELAPREAVLGEGLARQLEVSPGDELIVFLQAADGSLGNDLLVVVGITRTGNTAIDRLSVYTHLADLQFMAALEGRLHEISVRLDRFDTAPLVAEAIAAAVAATEPEQSLVVRPWQRIIPDMSTMLELYEVSIDITYLLIFAIVALGIVNAQRMSALERRREFGVLMAIGLRPGQLARVIMVETVVLTLAGALIGAALGLGLSWYHAVHGLDMSAFSDQASFSMMGVSFSERLFFVIKPRAVTEPLTWTFAVALLCGLWPALKSARLNVTQAISGRTD